MEETSWTPEVGENLIAVREESNRMDRHGVAVIKDGGVVGHLPFTDFWWFIHRGATIQCTVTCERMYSENLPQGGLEVPCTLTATGDWALAHKLTRLIQRSNLV